MDENKVIANVLNLNHDKKGKISTLWVALRGARELTGRNVESGKKCSTINFENIEQQCRNQTFSSNKFVGLATYLIIIDLIGNIFKHSEKKEIKDNFIQALSHFSTLNSEEISSLKNLRNSLAHKFSLGNESEVYVLDYSTTETYLIKHAEIIYPSVKRVNKKNDKNMTTVNYDNICDLVERIYETLKVLNDNSKLEIIRKYKIESEVKIYDFNSMYFVE